MKAATPAEIRATERIWIGVESPWTRKKVDGLESCRTDAGNDQPDARHMSRWPLLLSLSLSLRAPPSSLPCNESAETPGWDRCGRAGDAEMPAAQDSEIRLTPWFMLAD